jgi:hypothetical protein
LPTWLVALLVLTVAGCSGAGPSPVGNVGSTVDSGAPVDAGLGELAAPHCAYPPGSYATATGSTAPPSLTWQCFPPGAAEPSTLKVTDLLDCDGSQGIGAVVFDESSTWCSDCQTEASSMDALMAQKWTSEHVRVVTLMVEDESHHAATIDTARAWRDHFQLKLITVCADPAYTFKKTSGNGVPMSVLVDPRTMAVVAKFYNTPDPPEVDQLALQNDK